MVRQLIVDYQSGRNRFDKPGEALWAASAQDDVIGVCGLNVDPFADDSENAGRVRRLYVLPCWRRQGVARQLMDAVEEMATGNFSMLTAFTTEWSAAAFYAARGYEPVSGIIKRSFLLVLPRL